jgi:hypothetical protein
MKYIITLLVISLFGCTDRQIVVSGLEGQRMPGFEMLLMDSTTVINSNDIPAGSPLVLFYLSPYCPYCKAQTEDLTAKMNELKGINIYILSSFPISEIKKYRDKFQLSKYANITVGKLNDDTLFTKYYKVSGVPYIAVYNKEKRLNEVMLGNVPIRDIKEVAFQ